MENRLLRSRVTSYLDTLCRQIPSRRTGSAGNHQATDFFARTAASFGFEIEQQEFDCLDWEQEGAELEVGDASFRAHPSPFSPACNVRGPLAIADTVTGLEEIGMHGGLLLLHGDLAAEPLMPRNFPFYNPDEHRRIYALLEAARPAALVTASRPNPDAAGALYPLPMIEDGDFDIPSAYLTEEEGVRLAALAGQDARLRIRARRIHSRGGNVVAHKGAGPGRIVLTAHIDTKPGTPGALDNAAGVIVLLLLAELLSDYASPTRIELTAVNGEDHFANPGEQALLRANEGRWETIRLGINLDGLGHHSGGTAYSLYECDQALATTIRQTLTTHPGLSEGPAWVQGDHFLFLMNGRPALALTSERMSEIMTTLVHTKHDTPNQVDPARLVEASRALRDLLHRLAQR